MNRRIKVIGAFAVVALAAAGCGGGGTTSPTASKTLVVGVDLPFQGSSKDSSDDAWNAMNLYLEQVGGKAGNYKVALKKYDDSTAAKGAWDDAACAKNATDHVANENEVAVMGTFNSGCAKIEVPILNRSHPGPVLMVSPANTNPGLTKKWEAGEPNKYYPTGQRNYARVVATDDVQGPADALWSKTKGYTKVFVLNDKQTYGVGVARTYAAAAKKLGLQVVGNQGWDAKQSSYEALANQIKSSGAQAVFLGGIACNNGAKLMQDIKAVNPKIQLQMPDGFSDPNANGAVGNGAYISVAGQPPKSLTGFGATFVKSFGKSIGAVPNPYAAYGAQAMLVALQAVAAHGGDRAAVTHTVFGMQIQNGVLGNFSINKQGDTSALAITVYKQQGKNLNPVKTLTPTPDLVG